MKQKLLELLQSTEGFLSGQELFRSPECFKNSSVEGNEELRRGRIRDRGSAK